MSRPHTFFAASLLVAADLTASVRKVRGAPARVRDMVISATALRRGRVEWAPAAADSPAPGAQVPSRLQLTGSNA